jgi:hypothetical protein
MDDRDANDLAALGHEAIETDVRAVWRTGGAIAGVVIATFILIMGLMKGLGAAEGTPAAINDAGTQESANEQTSLQQLRVEEQKMVRQYKWVDKANGTARIPVGRAIEIISESGLPTALPGSAPPNAASPQQSTSPANPPANAEGEE